MVRFMSPFPQEPSKKVRMSHKGVAASAGYLAAVLVQDSMELYHRYPDHPMHKHLAGHSLYS